MYRLYIHIYVQMIYICIFICTYTQIHIYIPFQIDHKYKTILSSVNTHQRMTPEGDAKNEMDMMTFG